MPHASLRTALMSALSVFAACSSGPALSDVQGGCGDAHGADVCTWATLDGDELVTVGALIPLASIDQAPAEVAMTWPPATSAVVDLPEAAAGSVGMSHLTMYWEPMGHMPVTFMTPHFDFHFYLVPRGDRLAIDCSNTAKPATLPAGYGLPDEQLPPELVALTGVETLVGVCVPEMGMHALLAAEMEVQEPFSGTMVVGYYDRRPIFLEPMISRATLLARRSFELPVPEVPGLTGRQPTVFRADYDAELDAYRFEFSGFRQAE
jgi:hypothetical protein